MQQDNKPDNIHFPSLGKPDRRAHKGDENQAQEYINETGDAPPSTAQGGKQPINTNEQPRSYQYRNLDQKSKDQPGQN